MNAYKCFIIIINIDNVAIQKEAKLYFFGGGLIFKCLSVKQTKLSTEDQGWGLLKQKKKERKWEREREEKRKEKELELQKLKKEI